MCRRWRYHICNKRWKCIKQIRCANKNKANGPALMKRCVLLRRFSLHTLCICSNSNPNYIARFFVCVKRKPISGTFRITIRNLIRLSSAIAINTFIAFILLGTGRHSPPHSLARLFRFVCSLVFFFFISFFFVFSFDSSLYILCGESFASLIWCFRHGVQHLLAVVLQIENHHCSTDTHTHTWTHNIISSSIYFFFNGRCFSILLLLPFDWAVMRQYSPSIQYSTRPQW